MPFGGRSRFGYLVSLVYIYGKDIAIFYGLHSLVQYHFYIVFCGYILFFLGFVAQADTHAKLAKDAPP